MQSDLVERAARGDQEAFGALASQHVDRCYALAYRILRDPHRAQDATQQALLGAWRDLPTLRDLERFDAWLRRLVVNACYVEARGQRRFAARLQVLSSILRPSPTWRAPSPPGTSSSAPFASCHRNSGRSSCSTTTSGIR